MTRDQAATFSRRALRLAGIGGIVAGVVALGVLGWRWRASATVERVVVQGTRHTAPDSVRRLAHVEGGTGMTEVTPPVVADRVVRHPWIKEATVTRNWLYETLTVAVTERTPAALAVDAQGRPAYYLDRAGHALPLPDSAGYDVPLVRGLDAEASWTPPDTTLGPPALRRVLGALSDAKAADLVAEIEVRDDAIRLVTTPVGTYDALSVRLGTGEVAKKLRTFHAFARQVLATPPSPPIGEIDLRFDGQIVTRKHPLDG